MSVLKKIYIKYNQEKTNKHYFNINTINKIKIRHSLLLF